MSFAPFCRRFALPLAVVGVASAYLTHAALAERPTAPKLLPKKTLAYVRIADFPDLAEKFMETSMGRLGRDEKIKPLVMQLYGSAAQAFQEVRDQIGVSLDEIMSLPQGEVCFGMIGREEGEPAFALIFDVGDKMPVAQKLIEQAVQAAIRDGKSKRTEEVEGVTLTILDSGATFCDQDGTVLVTSNPDLTKEMLKTWSGDEGVETLADNREFTTIMRRSIGTKDERPQVTFFVDPIELFKNVSRNNPGAQVALYMLPLLGLDGVKSAGGSFIFSTEEFDSISHMHLLLDNPREGVLEMLAMEPGDTTPEDWVPNDAASYMTVNWNTEKTLETLRKLIDQFQGEGAFSTFLKRRMSDPLGIDFEKEVVEQVADRFTHVSWFEKPAKVNSGTNLIGVKLKDAKTFQKTMDKIVLKVGEAATKKRYRGVTYHSFAPRRRPQPKIDESLIRQPSPCIAVVGDYMLFSDSVKCLEAAISAKRDPSKSLDDELDYKLIASRIQQRLGSTRPAMVAFQRPEETMRSFYDLANSANTRRRLEEAAQNNQAFRALNDALRDNPLPPFSVIAKYLAPGGGMMVSDQTGIHYTTFSLKRE